ncbi:MAG: thioesterase [bacterium]|nr:MAG: thioesterase [bacterium]
MSKIKDFRKLANNAFRLKLFFIKNMPMGFLNGLRVVELDEKHASISVPYNYLTKNPFHSTYFAVQAMAAELSSGAMAIAEVIAAPGPVSMLVFDMNANFTKKARSKVVFTCNDGEAIGRAVWQTLKTGEGQTVTITSIGIDEAGDQVSEFQFTWTFKAK